MHIEDKTLTQYLRRHSPYILYSWVENAFIDEMSLSTVVVVFFLVRKHCIYRLRSTWSFKHSCAERKPLGMQLREQRRSNQQQRPTLEQAMVSNLIQSHFCHGGSEFPLPPSPFKAVWWSRSFRHSAVHPNETPGQVNAPLHGKAVLAQEDYTLDYTLRDWKTDKQGWRTDGSEVDFTTLSWSVDVELTLQDVVYDRLAQVIHHMTVTVLKSQSD